MPVYEYRCNHGHEFAEVEPMSAPVLRRCVWCRARARRVISICNHNFDAVITPADVERDFSPSAISQPIGYRRRKRKIERAERGVVLQPHPVERQKLDPRMMAKAPEIHYE